MRYASSLTPSTMRYRCRARALPGARRVVDSAMEMADRLVHTQYDFIRKVIDSAGKSLNRSDGSK
jgi:hypothetical protein